MTSLGLFWNSLFLLVDILFYAGDDHRHFRMLWGHYPIAPIGFQELLWGINWCWGLVLFQLFPNIFCSFCCFLHQMYKFLLVEELNIISSFVSLQMASFGDSCWFNSMYPPGSPHVRSDFLWKSQKLVCVFCVNQDKTLSVMGVGLWIWLYWKFLLSYSPITEVFRNRQGFLSSTFWKEDWCRKYWKCRHLCNIILFNIEYSRLTIQGLLRERHKYMASLGCFPQKRGYGTSVLVGSLLTVCSGYNLDNSPSCCRGMGLAIGAILVNREKYKAVPLCPSSH